MLNVSGGKLTTYRRIALEALHRLRADLGLHRLRSEPEPLRDRAAADVVGRRPDLDPVVSRHLRQLYGSLAPEVLAPTVDEPALLERLHPSGPDIAAQARYAATHEWARSADDVVRRRTTCFWRGLESEELTARVSHVLADRLLT
jgi:glycerol-3-phosphate dehydrogenase